MEKPAEEEKRPSPRILASLQFTEQGRMLLQARKADDAINVLERAVSLNPANGQNYYYLAEAWLMKKNTLQAEEYNRLAALYLEGNSLWMDKVNKQKEEINKRKKK